MTGRIHEIEELIRKGISDPKMDIREEMVSLLASAIDADEGLYIYGTSSAEEENGELTVTMTQDDRGNRFLPVYTSCKVSFDNNAGGLNKLPAHSRDSSCPLGISRELAGKVFNK